MSEYRRVSKSSFLVFLLLISVLVLSTCSRAPKTIVYRDIWGIPHIYGESEVDLAYAFGYSQAEDRLEQILSSYRYAEGTMAEAFGEKYVESDYVQRVWQHQKICKEGFSRLSPQVQQFIHYYIAGIKQYMQNFPEKVPDWTPEIFPWHPVALGRAFIWGWPLGQAMEDLERGLKEPEPPHHSNQWAVCGGRTALGVPIALIDPHLNFFTGGHFFEVRMHAGDWHVCGMCVVGTPFVGLGHNEKISWAATTGGPDCADVYELEINPKNKNQYLYDKEWRNIMTEETILKVKTDSGFIEEKRVIERSHYGPIVKREENKAYAIKCAYENEVLLAEQALAMNKSQNLSEFKKALSMCQFMPQNIMVACSSGDIYYARTGRVPKRPNGFDWNRPVPGNNSKSEWLGIHPHEDLVQITNPEAGIMQNCNISPGTMMPNSPLTADKYPDYIYNDPQNRSNPRGRSAIRLLSKEEKLTVQRAQEIALDTSVDGFEMWQEALELAFKDNSHSFSDVKNAVSLVNHWNGRLDANNQSATLFRFWRRECSKLNVKISLNKSKVEISAGDKRKILVALRRSQKYLLERFGSIDIPWGETVRLKRDRLSWPVSGGSFENGIDVLRAAGGNLNEKTGITTVDRGQSCCMIVVFSNPMQSFSILPFGESDDPESSHYKDQAEKLFSKSQFKSTFFNKEELLQNLESAKEIQIPVIKSTF
jgi:acyl-homoserine-lactone acylase